MSRAGGHEVAPLSPRSPKKKFSVLWGNKEDGVSEVHASLLETRLWLQEDPWRHYTQIAK